MYIHKIVFASIEYRFKFLIKIQYVVYINLDKKISSGKLIDIHSLHYIHMNHYNITPVI